MTLYLRVSKEFFKLGVEHNYAPAQFALCRMYELCQKEIFLYKDVYNALKLYELAAAEGHDEALQAKTSLLLARKRAQEEKAAAKSARSHCYVVM